MSGPRRILMTADTVGGVWTYALELAANLSRCGVHVDLATLGAPPNRAQLRAVEALPKVRLFPSHFRLEWMRDSWGDVQTSGDWLLDLERELRPDLVHLNQYAFGALPFRAPKVVVGHSCVYSWWHAVHGEDPPGEWSPYRSLVARGLAGADQVVAPTQAMLAELERHYRLPHRLLRRPCVIPNGRDAGRFRAPRSKEPFILSVGRLWDEGKNLRALDRAADGLPWKVKVAGATEHPDGGDDARARNVKTLGTVPGDEISGWFSRASIYALPARYEPFGLSVLEAALAGCALVLGDIPSLRENWQGVARFVDPDDPEALRSSLRKLIEDDAERLERSTRARARALHFGPERQTARYLELYDDLLGERSPAPSRAPGLRAAPGAA